MIALLQKTWFVWWILATLFTLRWFHLVSIRPDGKGTFEPADSAPEKASRGSNRIPSEVESSLFT